NPRRFWEPCPPPVLANPAETSPTGSRYLYKYVYRGLLPQVKLFSSAKEASADRPQKSLLFRLAGLPPEEVTFLASSGIRQASPRRQGPSLRRYRRRQARTVRAAPILEPGPDARSLRHGGLPRPAGRDLRGGSHRPIKRGGRPLRPEL